MMQPNHRLPNQSRSYMRQTRSGSAAFQELGRCQVLWSSSEQAALVWSASYGCWWLRTGSDLEVFREMLEFCWGGGGCDVKYVYRFLDVLGILWLEKCRRLFPR